jgi:transposase
MVYRKISADLKLAAVRLYLQNVLNIPTICHSLGFSESTFWRILALYRETGSTVCTRATKQLGGPQILFHEDIEYLLALTKANPSFFLNELLSLAQNNCYISVHFSTIFCALEHCNVSHKKLKSVAAERNKD